MNEVLLSIIIPTRGRPKHAHRSIESIIPHLRNDVELVIQDNGPSHELFEILRTEGLYERVNYVFEAAPLSFVDNFNRALSVSKGEYVLIIGDDDTISADLFDAVDWAKEHNVDAICGETKLTYVWPDANIPDTFFSKKNNSLLLIEEIKNSLEFIDGRKEVIKFLESGCVGLNDFKLSRLYHGVVRRSILEAIKEMGGEYIGGLSPDVYSSIAISLIAQKQIRIGIPITLPGTCGKSGSVREGVLKRNSLDLKSAPHFNNRKSYRWNPDVPYIYTTSTIWADSALAAITDLGEKNIYDHFRVSALLSGVAAERPELFYELLRVFLNRKRLVPSLIGLIKYVAGYLNRRYIKRIYTRAMIILGICRVTRLYDISGISEAQSSLDGFKLKNKYNLMACVCKR